MDFTSLIKELRTIVMRVKARDEIFGDQFYKSCAKALHKSFENNLKSDYLFSFPYISKKHTLQYNPSKGYFICKHLKSSEQNEIKKHLRKGEEQLKHGECLSITDIMVNNLFKDEIQSLLIKRIKGNPKEFADLNKYTDELIQIDITLPFKKGDRYTPHFIEIANRLHVTKEEYEKLFNRFDIFVNLPKQNHVVYLIKPYSYHKQFNVVLILALKKALTANEFNFIRLLIYRFVSEVAIEEIERMEEEDIRTEINHELNHTWNSYFRSLGRVVANEIIPLADNQELDKLEKKKDYLLSNINSLIVINNFFVGLMKAGKNFQNLQNLINQPNGKEYTFLIETDFSILNNIRKVAENLKNYFNPDDDKYPFYIDAINELIKNMSGRQDCRITTLEIAFEIIMLNLMKNALIHSELKNKKIEVDIREGQSEVEIEIKNNGVIRKDWLDYMNGRTKSIEGVEFSAGIKTIQMVAVVQRPKWIIKANNLYEENEAAVVLTIPYKK